MKLLSLNVGLPQPYTYHGRDGYTSIFKTPVTGEKQVTTLNINGDKQSDLTVHGGLQKAVYSYDVSYYQHWKKVLQRDDWDYGLFGENLTTEGLPDSEVCVGDIFQIGTVLLKAVQPRFPCFKLNIRFGSERMIKLFTEQALSGTYFSVEQEGSLQGGDEIKLIERSRHKVTIQQFTDCYYNKGADQDVLHQLLEVPFLPNGIRRAFESFVN